MTAPTGRVFRHEDLYDLFTNANIVACRREICKRFVEFVALREGWSQSDAVAYLLSADTITNGLRKTDAVVAAERERAELDGEPVDPPTCPCAQGCEDCLIE